MGEAGLWASARGGAQPGVKKTLPRRPQSIRSVDVRALGHWLNRPEADRRPLSSYPGILPAGRFPNPHGGGGAVLPSPEPYFGKTPFRKRVPWKEGRLPFFPNRDI